PTSHMDGGEGDHYYTLLEGNDILADVFIGRLSFNSISEFQTILNKILNYEKEPYLDETNWYNTALLVGDPSSSGQSCIYTKQSIKEMMGFHAPNINCIEVYSGSWVSQMSNYLNLGVSYFNYRGYYGMSGWDNYDTNNLTNGFKLPVVITLTCGTGDFESGTSISEAFLRAGSVSVPRGGIAAVGTATLSTHTCFNNCVDGGTYYGIFADHIYNMGGALTRGKLNLYINYPTNPNNSVYKFSYWNNLMGDPGMELWTGIPQEMNVIYDSDVPLGSNLLEVVVQNISGLPLKNAWVTALMGDDEIFSTGFTDSEGIIYLELEELTGTVDLTVTHHNFIPHLGSFEITQSDFFINVEETIIDDDNIGTSSGNDNGLINPGESIELGARLKNYGTNLSTSVNAVLSSDCDFITITDDTEEYGDIPAGNSVISDDDFDFSVDNNVLGGSEIPLDFTITDGNGNEWINKVFLNVNGPNIIENNHIIYDDNNSIFDPGETVELVVILENIGSQTVDNISAIISCTNDDISIFDDYGYFGTIVSGGQANNIDDSFELQSSSQILPGSQIPFQIQISNDSGYESFSNFIIEVGEVDITDPLGPDGYGYYCYDDNDIDYDLSPMYFWHEIDPDYGGDGTSLNFYDNGDTGDIEDINLPFDLYFYGRRYESITICSNGWIAPGETSMKSFMNWS
ncbi:MAG TPA: hypothetical protein ENL20_04415, partial [Candidatus Cloacimonetes bacterium]|nr:hypothetical protein [Candidatus Cloacimonadota bacterium]